MERHENHTSNLEIIKLNDKTTNWFCFGTNIYC